MSNPAAVSFRIRERMAGVRRRLELRTLALVALAIAPLWLFVEVADEVVEGETRAFDRAIVLALRNPADLSDPRGPLWVEEMGRDFTALGGVGVLTLVTIAGASFLWLQGNRRTALYVVAAIAGGSIAGQLLKELFDRPRPDLVPHLSHVYTTSFPSGHSMMSTFTYLTLGGILARSQRRRREKAFLLGTAIALAVLVGLSRIYLGVHWPTDVLAGWAAGAAWALLCVLVARWLSRRGHVEAEEPELEAPPRRA